MRATLEERSKTPPRAYIGASSIGNVCDAFLALTLRGFRDDPTEPKTQRIFWLGHQLEEVVVDLLKKAAVPVKELDPRTGRQWHFDAEGGHLQANLDGLVFFSGYDKPASHTLEIKSMNVTLFKSFMERGLYVSHPHYVDQVQLGMGLSGIHQCLMVAYCKNNSDLWVEVIYFDHAHYQRLRERSTKTLEGSSAKHEGWGCTRCHKRTACKTGAVLPEDQACRHCKHAMPVIGGNKSWVCTLHGHITKELCSDFSVFRPTP